MKKEELDVIIKTYILKCLVTNPEASDILDIKEGEVLTTDKEKLNYFFRKFELEKNFSSRSGKGAQLVLSDYLRGLPSSISINFTNYDIENLGVLWGIDKPSFIENWWDLLAENLILLQKEKEGEKC